MLKLPRIGIKNINFYSNSNLLLAKGYERIEFGKRGPYVEFVKEQIVLDNFYIPLNEKWRITSECAYYIEFRSKCESYVKLYLQKHQVKYAKYEIGKFYISPNELTTDLYGKCIQEKQNLNLEGFF